MCLSRCHCKKFLVDLSFFLSFVESHACDIGTEQSWLLQVLTLEYVSSRAPEVVVVRQLFSRDLSVHRI